MRALGQPSRIPYPRSLAVPRDWSRARCLLPVHLSHLVPGLTIVPQVPPQGTRGRLGIALPNPPRVPTPTQQPGTPYPTTRYPLSRPHPYPVARTPYLEQIPLRPYKRRRACERIGRWSGPVRSLAHALRHREGSRGSSYPVSPQRVCYILFVVSDVWRSTDHSIIRSPPGHRAG